MFTALTGSAENVLC